MTPQTALPAAFSHTFLSEQADGRRLSLEQLYGCAAAAVTYGDAKIDLDNLQNADQFSHYFKCTAIGHYLLKDDSGAVFNVEHRKPDDKWSLLTTQHGWINQEYINRKLSRQSAA